MNPPAAGNTTGMDIKYNIHDLVYLNDKNRTVIEATVINTTPWGECTLLLERGEIYYSFQHRIYSTWTDAFATLPILYKIRHYAIVASAIGGAFLTYWLIFMT